MMVEDSATLITAWRLNAKLLPSTKMVKPLAIDPSHTRTYVMKDSYPVDLFLKLT